MGSDVMKRLASAVSMVIALFPFQSGLAQAPQLLAELMAGVTTYQVAWSPDGQLIAAATESGALILDQSLAVVATLQGHNELRTVSVAWNPDGTQLATGGGRNDSNVRIWARDLVTNSFTPIRALETGKGSVSVLVWSPDGQKLAGLNMVSTNGGPYTHLNIWSAFDNWVPEPRPGYIYIKPLFDLTWSFDSQLLALAGGAVCTPWTVPCGQGEQPGFEGTIVINASGEVAQFIQTWPPTFSLDWSPIDLQLAATSNTDIDIYEGSTGALTRRLPHSLLELAWSPDGTKLAGSGGNSVQILDANSGEITLSFPFYEARSIQWSPDGSRLAVSNLNGFIQIWQVIPEIPLPTPTLAAVDPPPAMPTFTQTAQTSWIIAERIAWSPDSSKLAIAAGPFTCDDPDNPNPDAFAVSILDVATGQVERRFRGSTCRLVDVAWSPDGAKLATSSLKGYEAFIWDVATEMLLTTAEIRAEIGVQVVWSPDSTRIASTASGGEFALVWGATTGEVLFGTPRHADPTTSVAWSPDGNQIATSSLDSTVLISDAATQQTVLTLSYTDQLYWVSWSPDGAKLASASRDSTVQLWDVSSGQLLNRFQGHTDSVERVVWKPDGTQVASVSQDGTIRVWDAGTGQVITVIQLEPGLFTDIAWSPDGNRFAYLVGDSDAQTFPVEIIVAPSACDVTAANRSGTPATTCLTSRPTP